jgi:hypothetical protein
MCHSQEINYALCGCKIYVPTRCAKSKQPKNLWRKMLRKPIGSCKVWKEKNLYLNCWCYRCGSLGPQTRKRTAANWATEKDRLRSERVHPPMSACRDLNQMAVTFHANSLPLWEQEDRWRKNVEDGMIMQQCSRTCGEGPLLWPADDRLLCCNELCTIIDWEDWQGFSDSSTLPRNPCISQIGSHYPNGVYLCYHTEDGMACAPPYSRRGFKIERSRDTDFENHGSDMNSDTSLHSQFLTPFKEPQQPRTLKVALPCRPATSIASHQIVQNQSFEVFEPHEHMPRYPERPKYRPVVPLSPLIPQRRHTTTGNWF